MIGTIREPKLEAKVQSIVRSSLMQNNEISDEIELYGSITDISDASI